MAGFRSSPSGERRYGCCSTFRRKPSCRRPRSPRHWSASPRARHHLPLVFKPISNASPLLLSANAARCCGRVSRAWGTRSRLCWPPPPFPPPPAPKNFPSPNSARSRGLAATFTHGGCPHPLRFAQHPLPRSGREGDLAHEAVGGEGSGAPHPQDLAVSFKLPRRIAPRAQATHEVEEAGLAVAAGAFGSQDRVDPVETEIDIVIDDHVIIFRPMADLIGGPRHAPLDHLRTVLRPQLEPAPPFPGRGRQDENTHQILAHDLLQRLRSLPIDVEEHDLTRPEPRLDTGSRRAVMMIEDLGMLEKLAVLDHPPKRLGRDEAVINPLHFARPARPRRHRDRHRNPGIALQQMARERALARARGRGQDEHQAATCGRGISHGAWPFIRYSGLVRAAARSRP